MNLNRFLIISFFVSLVSLTACRHNSRSYQEADALFHEGLELRTAKNTEAAAESFSNALLAINRCNANDDEVKRLKAQIEDNLGAMFWKHKLSEEAMILHLDAVELLRELNEPALLMKALRNCGRVKASQQNIEEAQGYYNEAMQLGKTLNDTVFCNEILMETSHDLFLESGDYNTAIENANIALGGGADPDFCNLVIGLSGYYLKEDSLAFACLRQAAQSPKPSIRMSAYQGLCQLYQFVGDYPQALECHKLFSDNMMQANQESRRTEVERIRADYELQMQEQNIETKQKQRITYLYLALGVLLAYLFVVLLLLRQKTLSERLKVETIQHQLEVALKKNKVYVTALALTEQITASTLDFALKESDWDDFLELIDQIYDDFTQRLMAKYPTLTPGDLQICCLTKQGFSNQVISILMNMQAASYARRKSRIKQDKMNGLEDERSFEEIISEI